MLKYIIAGCVVMVFVFLTVTSTKTMNKERKANQSQQGQAGEMNPLTLKDYPKLSWATARAQITLYLIETLKRELLLLEDLGTLVTVLTL